MMDDKIKSLWKNIKKHGRLLKSYTKEYYENGYYTTNTYKYNDKTYFAILHNWKVVFLQDCEESKVLLARDGYERMV